MEPSKLRSEILEISRIAEDEPLSTRSIQARLETAGSEPDLEPVRDACVSLVIEGELDVVANGSDRRFKHASEP